MSHQEVLVTRSAGAVPANVWLALFAVYLAECADGSIDATRPSEPLWLLWPWEATPLLAFPADALSSCFSDTADTVLCTRTAQSSPTAAVNSFLTAQHWFLSPYKSHKVPLLKNDLLVSNGYTHVIFILFFSPILYYISFPCPFWSCILFGFSLLESICMLFYFLGQP